MTVIPVQAGIQNAFLRDVIWIPAFTRTKDLLRLGFKVYSGEENQQTQRELNGFAGKGRCGLVEKSADCPGGSRQMM